VNILNKLLYVTLSSSVLLIAQPANKDTNLKYVNKQGKDSSTLLLKTLGKNMKKQMKSGGVMKALDFCANEAYTITEDVNKKLKKGVSVKRISTNYRSPANKPTADELKVLDLLNQMNQEKIVMHKIVQKVDEHTYKYYKPLIIKKQVCLKCHGDVKNIDLKRAIAAKYPLDKATGYKMGDLRGAIVVTIKK